MTHPEHLQVGADELVIRSRSDQTGGALFAAEVRMPPGGGPPLMHRHDPSELYHVLEGEFAFYVADDAGTVHRSIAAAGTVMPVAGGRSHTIRNESDREARAFVVFAPGEQMERFFRAAAALAADGAPQIDDVLALAERHGVQMTGSLQTS